MTLVEFFKQQTLSITDWSPHPDLNRGPLPYQGSALPLSYVGSSIASDCRSFHYRSPTTVEPSCLERVMGIEPTSSAWKAEVLPLNYTRRLAISVVRSLVNYRQHVT